MATIVLSAAGAAAGAAIGGNVLGLSSVVIGRAVGATVGRLADRAIGARSQSEQPVLGGGSDAVDTAMVERIRIQGAQEGGAVSQVYGRVRRAGQVIWATRFGELVETGGDSGSGKGILTSRSASSSAGTAEKSYSYTISLAVALCEGEITGVGRIWADGEEIRKDGVAMRVYLGSETQQPDPKIEAVQGAGQAPAYRGLAYVVFEDIDLGAFGNRVPQFSFEILRPEPPSQTVPEIARGTRAVAMIPGTGEYSLATEAVYFDHGPGQKKQANLNNSTGKTDFLASFEQLRDELPNCGAVSMIVSWFGDDLRCGQCSLRPKVEQRDYDSAEMPWAVSGLVRDDSEDVPRTDDRPIYGGTPTDRGVIQAIQKLRGEGKAVTFYPFILMTQMEGNTLVDPWTGASGQAHLPWRGRITSSLAPGVDGSPDGTGTARDEVAAFFGAAGRDSFTETADGVAYTGPEEWSYRRFILHYAHLCKAAGGIDSFCIGSEMRALTQIRGENHSFPTVEMMCQLVDDVRHILGPNVKIGYASDWSEYFGYHPADGSGNVYFHLDPLWSHPDVDFIGIDNYMPLSDWRDTGEHADAHWGSIYDLDYLRSNVAGGEGYDWYYESEHARRRQDRRPITDGAHGEPWVFRYKDLKNWWSHPHHNRIDGVRQAGATAWQPQSKPIWFTEFGCGAIDKGTNQPNKFIDPKSSESRAPHFSTGARDEYIQMQYVRAMHSYWGEASNNPTSAIYGGSMVDMSRAFIWAWDARPYPFFPARTDVWSDGDNYTRGHWLNGRTANRSLAGVVEEICARSGVTRLETRRLYGLVRGYTVSDTSTARAALQPLMLAYGFDAIERGGKLEFRSRVGRVDRALSRDTFSANDELEGDFETTRAPDAELVGRQRVVFAEAGGDFDIRAAEAVIPDEATHGVSQTDLPLVLTRAEGRAIVERWLAEARLARDSVRFALPPSVTTAQAGDVVTIETEAGPTEFRIDRVEQSGSQIVEAVRTDGRLFGQPAYLTEEAPTLRDAVEVSPVLPVFLDLPLLDTSQSAHAPHLAVVSKPWPGPVNVFKSSSDAGYQLVQSVEVPATVGFTTTELAAAKPGLIDRGAPLRVKLVSGVLSSAELERVLNGANAAAIGGPGTEAWEVLQFASAELVGEDEYAISGRLRGQAGTDGVMPPVWPAGSHFVLLDARVDQLALPLSEIGLERHYRIGPASVPYSDPAYVHDIHAFSGIGLRPYAPAHLRALRLGDGSYEVGWTRRTRIDGDSWDGFEVPLGENRELYRLLVRVAGIAVRDVVLNEPRFTYGVAEQAADGVTGDFEIAVAQISDRFGPGPFERIQIDG